MNGEIVLGLTVVVVFLLIGWGFVELMVWLSEHFAPIRILWQIIGILCGISIIKDIFKDRDDTDWR